MSNININNLLNKPNNEIEEIILNYKNPLIILQLCTINKYFISACIDSNGFIWSKLLDLYYPSLIELRNLNINQKDYYVLLFNAEVLQLLQIPIIIYKAQRLLHLLPKIYHDDHIIILNALCNTAILTNKARIAMFRNNINSNLNIRYLNIDRDIYLHNENSIHSLKESKNVDPIIGNYFPE